MAETGFRSARTLDWGVNDRSSDPLALRAVALGPALPLSDLEAWLERALNRRSWLIIVLHLVAERNRGDYAYFCSLTDFQRLLDAVQSRPFWIAPQRQVVDHLFPLGEGGG